MPSHSQQRPAAPAATARHVLTLYGLDPQGGAEAELVALIGPCPDSVIVVGRHTLEVACHLLRRGCRHVAAICPGAWPRTERANTATLLDTERPDGLSAVIA